LPGEGIYSKVVSAHVRDFALEPFLGKVYTRHVLAVSSDEAYALLRRGRTPDQVVLVGTGPVSAPSSATSPAPRGAAAVRLRHATFNRLLFDIEAPDGGYFGLSHPWSQNWSAAVNGAASEVYRANGAAMAVAVPAGGSEVEFRFRSPAAVAGFLVSMAAVAAAIALSAMRLPNRRRRILAMCAAPAIATTLFLCWHTRLYGGSHLGTRYQWRDSVVPGPPNIAYAKTTAMSSILSSKFPHLFCSGRAVDGDTGYGTGCVTDSQPGPWWLVDLGHCDTVASVRVHERVMKQHAGAGPRLLTVLTSEDSAAGWEKQEKMSRGADNRTAALTLPSPVRARFVRVSAEGYYPLALDEVEIRPPPAEPAGDVAGVQ
jgi:hypothetical protein